MIDGEMFCVVHFLEMERLVINPKPEWLLQIDVSQ